MQIIVKEESERLDKYLKEKTNITRSTIEKMIDENYILVNNVLQKPSYKVKENDVITIKDGYKKETDLTPTYMKLDIIYEDEDILVINKPSGLIVHPGSGNYKDTLANALLYYCKNLSNLGGTDRPGIVHRLDKDTSGVLVIAKNNTAHQILSDEFKNHQDIEKTYLAIVCGNITHNKATIDAPIGRDETNRKKMSVTSKNSKNAITHFKVLEHFKNHTYIEVKIETGRTHQIRVHMKYINHPILNDPVYANKNIGPFGQYLHAYKLTIIHPTTKEKMTFTSPLPKEFQEKLEELRQES